MPYETINVHVSGPNPTEKKEEIKKAAHDNHFPSLSAFIMWLYEEWKKKHGKKGSK